MGLTCLLLCRVVQPSYEFLVSYVSAGFYPRVQRVLRPELFAVLEERGRRLGGSRHRLNLALVVICKIVLHTGRDVDQLTAEDVLVFRSWSMQHADSTKSVAGISLAWILLREVTDLGQHLTLRDAVRYGQRPTAALVDGYEIQCLPVRDVLVRYLDERRAGLDYRSFTIMVGNLAGRFWADLEEHHPSIDSLHLPDEVADVWKQRMRTITAPDGATRPRRGHLALLICIRSFYRDVQEWALQDPSWAAWSVPCPVRKVDTAGHMKAKKKVAAEMHQRARERLPRLPVLVDAVERHKSEQAAFLAALQQTPVDATFEHQGNRYRRTLPKAYRRAGYRDSSPPAHAKDVRTGEIVDVQRAEREAFWCWAVIETLRHTGIRVEELVEITHLALVSYQLPDTGEQVPMLQIVPSKSNEERLLLVSPELASVLASIITRLRRDNDGMVPLTARYDPHEHVTGPPLPHLFQHRHGPSWAVPNFNLIRTWLDQAIRRAGLTDAEGKPLRYTPHDFRRIFATEAASAGLPVHIISRLLGHKNLNTTQAYIAVFDEELVRSYRAFLDNRRALRPEAEYREPTDREWQEFHEHFELRKLELGECGRPYGTPCQHEHACIRCPSLRVDLRARPRLVEIIANLRDRIREAELNGWRGEVTGLQVSLHEASRKLTRLDRAASQYTAGPVNLGIPTISGP